MPELNALIEAAKKYNKHIVRHGKMSRTERDKFFKQHLGVSLRTWQERIRGMNILIDKQSGLYAIPGQHDKVTVKLPEVIDEGGEIKMTRTTIYMPKEKMRQVKKMAIDLDMSFTELNIKLFDLLLNGTIKL